MRVVEGWERVAVDRRSCVTIGAFDGVHRGHRRLINNTIDSAHKHNHVSVVITFAPHPMQVLSDEPCALLTTPEERAEILASLDLDLLVIVPFTPELAGLSADAFVGQLIERLHLSELWVGPDFTLGHKREGDITTLRDLGNDQGFTVHVVEPLVWQGEEISSSRVRAALQAGNLDEANGCLGRPYRLAGTVTHGRGVGKSIGIPTANLSLPPNRLIPARGVYACEAHVERGRTHPAAVNVGIRPTFAGESMVVEAHLLDFEGSLYSREMTLDFVARLRGEQVYPTLNALVGQVERDIARVRDLLA